MRGLSLAVLLGSGAAWGSTQALGKMAVSTGHGPFGLIFWQLAIGAVVMGAACAARGRPPPLSRRTLGFAALVAVVGTLIPNTTFYLAVARLPAGVMSIVISTVPLLALPMAIALGQDRATPARLLGLLCGAAGMAILAGPGATLPLGASAAWLLVAMGGPLLYAVEANLVARLGTAGMDPAQAMALASAVGAALALPLALGSGQWVDPLAPWGRAEAALLLSSVVHVVAYASYLWLAARAGAVFASQTSYVVTATGVVWAMLLLGERFDGPLWIALALTLGGLALVRPRRSSGPASALRGEAALR